MAESKLARIKPQIRRRSLRADPELHAIWERHAHQAGEVVTAWNELQAALYWLFKDLLKDSREVALAIWHSTQNDRTQRQMLLSVAELVLAGSTKALGQVRWAKERADDLATHRNDPAHTPFGFTWVDG